MTEPIFDQDRLDVDRLSIDHVAFSYDLPKTLAGTNRHTNRHAPGIGESNRIESNRIESSTSTSTAMLSTSTSPPPKP
jgi:hypothetical protein